MNVFFFSSQILIDQKADANLQNDRGETALHEALEKNNEAAAEALATTADANLYLETKYKETPLHIAARKNMHKIVPLLLKHGSPVNAQDLYGNTALHLAASKGYKEVVRILVENGDIQLNVSNKEGLTPLHLAVESGFIYTVEVYTTYTSDRCLFFFFYHVLPILYSFICTCTCRS